MPPLLALYAKQFLEIKLFTFDYHENKSQRTVDCTDVLLNQRFIVRRSSPLKSTSTSTQVTFLIEHLYLLK